MKRLIPLAALICISSQAQAQSQDQYPTFEGSPPVERYSPKVKAWVHRPHVPAPQVKTVTVYVEKEPPKPKKDPRCKDWVSALGDSAKSIDAAKLEAMKSWKAEVQFQHGNRYLSPDAVDAFEFQCAPSSVPFYGGKIENVVGKVLPIQSYVCKVSAQPCEAGVIREYGGK